MRFWKQGLIGALAGVFITLSFANLGHAQATLSVDQNDPACDNVTGTPFCDIQPAIDAAAANDIIQIAPGTYTENLLVGQSLTFDGAGQGTDPTTDTIVDGGAADSVFNITTGDVTFIDLTITNGDAAGSGGGINSLDGAITITNCLITGNNTSGSGGGVNQLGSEALVVTNSMIDVNTTEDGSGGGINTNSDDVQISGSSVSGNTSNSGSGGGISDLGSGSLTIVQSNINDNHAVGGGSGGGVVTFSDNLSVDASSISNNTSESSGGGIDFLGVGTFTILNSTISNNSGGANGSGGGINFVGDLGGTITFTTMDGNSSPSGGAINHLGSEPMILKNSIISNSLLDQNCNGTGGFTSQGHNVSDDASCNLTGTGDLPDTEPMLGLLQNNGGPTLTQALQLGSAAIDLVPAADCTDANGTPVNVDQRSVTRPSGVACDAGAFELAAGTVQFSQANYVVDEDAGIATITVTRTGGSDGTVTVDFTTSDGTAIAGQDYVTTSGTLTFLDGETSQTFDVPIIGNTIVDGDRTVNLTLSNPTGATIGTPNPAILTILDNDVVNNLFLFGSGALSCGLNTGQAIAKTNLLIWVLAFAPLVMMRRMRKS